MGKQTVVIEEETTSAPSDSAEETTATQAIAVVERSEVGMRLPALGMAPSYLTEELMDAKGDEGFLRLDRVTIPLGGGTKWTLPTLDDDEDGEVDRLIGLVLGSYTSRALYLSSYDPNNVQPPDCASLNGVNGRGSYGIGSEKHPAGTCKDCPMAQWKSEGGKTIKPACAQKSNIVFLPLDRVFPVIIALPGGSLSKRDSYSWPNYRTKLVNRGFSLATTVTQVTLVQKKVGNTKFSVAEFRRVATELTPLEQERARNYKKLVDMHIIAPTGAGSTVDESDEAGEQTAQF